MLGGKLRSAIVDEERGQATYWGTWPGDGGGRTWSGEVVDADSAMHLSTVLGCVQMISSGISTLPIDTYRQMPDGTKQEISKPAWLTQPTVDLSFAEWCGQVLTSVLLHGNTYVAVLRNEGRIVELPVIDPHRITVDRDDRTDKRYWLDGRVYHGEIVHIKGLMLPGSDVGLSPIEYARQTIGLGLATNRYGGRFFDGPGNMPGVIEAPRPMQPAIMQETAKAWQRFRKNGGDGLPGVLQDGMTWKAAGVTNEQAQFLATRKYTASQIAGEIFLLDPSDLGIGVEGSSITYANLEQRNVRRVQITFLPWLVRVEHAISALLQSVSYMKFNVSGLLRGDTLSRYQSYEIAGQIGVLTVDEMRALEDIAPLSVEDRKQSRAWQEVGLPALVADGLMTVNEARQQLGLPPVKGGDVPRDPDQALPQFNSVMLNIPEQRSLPFPVEV